MTPAQRVDLLHRLRGAEPVRLVHRPYNRGARREPSRPRIRCFTLRATAGRHDVDDGRAASATSNASIAAAASRRRQLQDGDGVPPCRGRRPHRAVCRRAWATWSGGRSPTSTRRTTCSTCTLGRSRSGGVDGVAPAYPAWRDTINLRPGRAGRDPDPVSRLRRAQRVPLPHRRAWRCRDDGRCRGRRLSASAPPLGRAAEPVLRRPDQAARPHRPQRAPRATVLRSREDRAARGANLGRGEGRETRRHAAGAVGRQHPVQATRRAGHRPVRHAPRRARASDSRGLRAPG